MSHKPTSKTSSQAAEGLTEGTPALDDLRVEIPSLSERSPLLAQAQEARGLAQSVASNPQGFVAKYAERVLRWALGPIIDRLPPVSEEVDESHDKHILEGLFLEICILIKYSIPSILLVRFIWLYSYATDEAMPGLTSKNSRLFSHRSSLLDICPQFLWRPQRSLPSLPI